MKYSQCLLKKGNTQMTSWIPEKFASKNRIIKLKNDDNTWDNGWQVMEAGSLFMDEEMVMERSRDFKKQRAASDI